MIYFLQNDRNLMVWTFLHINIFKVYLHIFRFFKFLHLFQTFFLPGLLKTIVGVSVLHFFRRGSVSQSQIETQSNAYATISKLPMAPSSRRSLFNGSLDLFDHERDYATLDRSNRSPLGPVVPGITSTPLSYTLPRRDPRLASTDFGGSEYYLGGDGEPQIVGNLS